MFTVGQSPEAFWELLYQNQRTEAWDDPPLVFDPTQIVTKLRFPGLPFRPVSSTWSSVVKHGRPCFPSHDGCKSTRTVSPSQLSLVVVET